MARRITWFAISSLVAALAFPALSLPTDAALPKVQLSAVVSPREWAVNQAGELRIQVKVVRGSLPAGSRISLGFPGSWTWHATRPLRREGDLVKVAPAPIAEFARYFSILPKRSTGQWKLDAVERDFEGSYHRFDRELILTLASGQVKEGEGVVLSYGTSSMPIRASRLAEEVGLRVRFDRGDGVWLEAKALTALKTVAGRAEKLLVTAASQGTLREPVRVHITARDRFGNVAALPSGLKVRTSDPAAAVIAITAQGSGFQERMVRFTKPGFQTVEAGTRQSGFYRSNPVLITPEVPRLKLYWGDLHSHSSISKDAIGYDSFRFARDYAAIDFFASTEHSSGDRHDDGITSEEWRAIQSAVKSFYEPGRFVTLLAYECSLPAPYGHHNVYFDTDEAPIYRRHEVKTLDELWRKLAGQRAFTVPHHTGVHWAAATWEKRSPLRPLFEIFSMHGQSERFDPQDPLSYDQLIGVPPYGTYPKESEATPEEFRNIVPLSRSAKGPHYAQDAWAVDLELGTIASSDDHTARPGAPYWGLAAVWAERLDRESIFQALLHKRAYGTTGQRIYLDFRVNDALPGKHVVSPDDPRVTVEVCGTNSIEWVEVLKFDRQTRAYAVLARWESKTNYLKNSIVDTGFSANSFYYVRLKQCGLVEGRPVMAWSSPIWVDRKKQG